MNGDENGERIEELSLSELLNDGAFIDGDWVESKDQDPNGEVRLIQLADVGDGVFRDRSSRFLTAEKAKELRCTYLQPGDILVARMPEPLGRACVFPGVGQPAVTVVDVCILRSNAARARSEWLMNAINAPDFRASMAGSVRGTTRQRISRKNLGKLTLHVPDATVQAAVAGAVQCIETRRGDAAKHVAAARVAIARLRSAVLAAACSGRLTAEWRENNPDVTSVEDALASVVAAKRRKDATSHEDLTLPTLPGRYLVTTLGAASHRIEYGTSRRAGPSGDVPVLRMGNIQNGRLDLSELKYMDEDAETAVLGLEDGDLLFNRTNSPELVGKSAVFHGSQPMPLPRT